MATVNTLLVEGTFDDQVAELAEYIDTLKGGEPTLAQELAPMLEKGEKEDVMEKLVEASSVLSQAPEKGMISGDELYTYIYIYAHIYGYIQVEMAVWVTNILRFR